MAAYDRSMLYLIWRACERWHLWPFTWSALPDEQRDLVLTYERVRMREELHVRGRTVAAPDAVE